MPVLDTNVIVRYLTQDDRDQGQRAFTLLQRIEAGNLTTMLSEGVLVETVQVLSSTRLYNVQRDVIRARLSAILRLPGVKLPNKRTCLRALDLYVDYPRLSFVDALCAAHAQRESKPTVISFDRDFENMPGITREEP